MFYSRPVLWILKNFPSLIKKFGYNDIILRLISYIGNLEIVEAAPVLVQTTHVANSLFNRRQITYYKSAEWKCRVRTTQLRSMAINACTVPICGWYRPLTIVRGGRKVGWFGTSVVTEALSSDRCHVTSGRRIKDRMRKLKRMQSGADEDDSALITSGLSRLKVSAIYICHELSDCSFSL